jgi:hypothetical protein
MIGCTGKVYRVRFTTATALINELAEAAHANQLSRTLGRWSGSI